MEKEVLFAQIDSGKLAQKRWLHLGLARFFEHQKNAREAARGPDGAAKTRGSCRHRLA
jgi:hypothetical protein